MVERSAAQWEVVEGTETGDAEKLAKLKLKSLKEIIDNEGLAVSTATGGKPGRTKVDIARDILSARDNRSEQSGSSSEEKKKIVLEIKTSDVQICVKADDGTITIGLSTPGKAEDVKIKIAQKEA